MANATASQLDYGAVYALLKADSSYATPLYLGVMGVLRQHMQSEEDQPYDSLLNLHPTALRGELRDILRITDIPQSSMDLLMAATLIAQTDLFYRDLPTFIDVCNILSGSPVSPDVFDPADVYEIAWALAEAYLLDPPETPDVHADRFSEEIREYIGFMAVEEGMLSLPAILSPGVMPANVSVPTFGSGDLDVAMAEADRLRHLELEDMLRHNLGELLSQLKLLWPGHEFDFQ